MPGPELTALQRKRAITLLKKVLNDSKTFNAPARRSALRALAGLDEKLVKRLAKKYLKSDERMMRREAQRILHIKPAAKKQPRSKSSPLSKLQDKMIKAQMRKVRAKMKARAQDKMKAAPKAAPPKPTQ
jgi:HEAT repeat protein